MIAKLARGASLAVAAGLLASAAHADPVGLQQFTDNCSACHRPNGMGVKGAFPALVGDPIATGDERLAAARVLNGKGGMPAFKTSLGDDDIAAALTYVRSAWGNHAGPVTAATVAAVRGAGKGAAVQSGMQAH